MCSTASWQPRPGLTPSLVGSHTASHSGSRALFAQACRALSLLVGIPRGRFSSFPGCGIHPLRTGEALPSRVSMAAISRRFAGSRFVSPSTPAVFLPLFSWVPCLTASVFAAFDRVRTRVRPRTARVSPRCFALSIRVCRLEISRASFRQGVGLHSSLTPCGASLSMRCLMCSLRRYFLSGRLHVSLASGFPRGMCFLKHPTL